MADPFADRRPRRPRDRSGHALPITPGDAVVRPLKTSESVARDIVHDIVTRGLEAGDRLPSEAAMLAEYGVSRESLREGLRLLEVQGLITLRRGPGGGPVVGHLDPANLGRTSTLYYHLAGGTYNELTEAWMLTESLLAHRAAQHPDRDAVRKAMEPFTSEIDPHGDQPVPGFVAEHTHFHHVVAEFAQNKVLEVMLQTIGLIVTHHIVVVGDPRDVRDTIAADHAEIARAVAAGHATKARRAMERHIGQLSDFYREQFGAQMDEFIDWR